MKTLILCAVLALVTSAFAVTPYSTLTWTQSATTGVTQNNVYRSQVSGGPYTEIFESQGPITTWTDNSVTPGQEYCYVVTAVVDGDESAYSNQSCITIVNTKPPTGLKTVQ